VATDGFLNVRLFSYLIIGAVLLGLGLLLHSFANTFRGALRARMFLLLGGVFAMFGLFRVYTAETSHARLTAAFEAGNYSTVSGVVEDFRPELMRRYGGRLEQFTIGGRTFTYGSGDAEAGFHKGRADNGPIRSGMRLRVDYIADRIVRIRQLPDDASNACT
jgi:hypothetical protein